MPVIRVWGNIDIAPKLAAMQVCRDTRYIFTIAPDWVWDAKVREVWKEAMDDEFDTVVATHVIEHLPLKQFQAFVDWVTATTGVKTLYLEAPLAEGPTDWTGYPGSHILPIGWSEVRKMLDLSGWKAEQVTGAVCVVRRD